MENKEVSTPEGGFRCLIADDSEYARSNVARVVEKLGGAVVGEARSGHEAVALYRTLRPDLVLMDITMPELDGIEALRLIRAGDAGAKVIMVSSLGHKEMLRKAILLGARHFITKPFTPEYASLVIVSVLAGAGGAAGEER